MRIRLHHLVPLLATGAAAVAIAVAPAAAAANPPAPNNCAEVEQATHDLVAVQACEAHANGGGYQASSPPAIQR